MSAAYGIIAAASLCMIGVCLALDKKRDECLLLVFMSVFVCNLGYYMVSISEDLSSALLSNRISYLGSVFLPFFTLVMVMRFCAVRRSRRLLGILAAVGIVVLGIACTPGIYPLYYDSVTLVLENGGSQLYRTYGPLHAVYYIYLFAYMAGMLGVSLRAILKKRIISRVHTVWLLSAVLCNIVIWLVEQFLPRGFEWLSVSYILTECFLLLLYRSLQKQGLMQTRTAVPFRIQLILAGFLLLLASYIRVAATGTSPMFYILSQVTVLLLYLLILITWGVSIYSRVNHRAIRRHLIALVCLMTLWFLARTLRHTVFFHVFPVGMWMWYAYYIPMLLIPTTCLLASRYIGRPEEFRLARPWYLLYLPAVLLTLGILTNDLHELAFSFYAGYQAGWSVYRRGPLYYLAAVWIFGCIVLMLIQFLRQCRIPGTKKQIWMPVGVLCIGLGYSILYLFDSSLFGFVEMTAALCFTGIGIWESCIHTGLIQSNTHYGSMFTAMRYPAAIADRECRVHYTGGAMRPLSPDLIRAARTGLVMPDPNTRLQSYDVSGGQLLWLEDITEINERLEDLDEIRERLSEENDLLTAENELREQRAAIETRNRLYANIVPVIRPQLDAASALLTGLTPQDPSLDRKLEQLCLYATYIKRRTNLALVPRENDCIEIGELASAVRETLHALSRLGVESALNSPPAERIPADEAILAYEWIEAAAEAALPTLQSMIINLRAQAGALEVRIALEDAAAVPPIDFKRPTLLRRGGRITHHREDDGELLLRLTFRTQGGDAV